MNLLKHLPTFHYASSTLRIQINQPTPNMCIRLEPTLNHHSMKLHAPNQILNTGKCSQNTGHGKHINLQTLPNHLNKQSHRLQPLPVLPTCHNHCIPRNLIPDPTLPHLPKHPLRLIKKPLPTITSEHCIIHRSITIIPTHHHKAVQLPKQSNIITTSGDHARQREPVKAQTELSDFLKEPQDWPTLNPISIGRYKGVVRD